MGARKYTPQIVAFCTARGIDVPPPFMRNPASPLAVVLLDRTPPQLSAKTFFKKEDLHYYIRSKMKELKVSDASTLPLQVLDFRAQIYLRVRPDGRTEPGQPIAPAPPEK